MATTPARSVKKPGVVYEGEPVLRLTGKATGPKQAERELLFTIGDEQFTIVKDPPGKLLVRYLRDLREVGMEVAVANITHSLIGKAGMDALAECEDFTTEDFQTLLRAIQHKIAGKIEEAAEGNS